MQKGFATFSSHERGLAPILILAGILVIMAVAGGAYYFGKLPIKPINSPKACTQEAKQCSDGSYVSREGPNCEFKSCPTSLPTPSSDETANWKTYTSTEYGFSIEYPPTWEINDSNYKRDKVLEKIVIEESSANQVYGIFEIVILADDNLSLEQWITKNRNIYYLIKAQTQNTDKGKILLDRQQARQFTVGHYSWPPDRVIISQHSHKIFIISFADFESLEEVDLGEGYKIGYERLRRLNGQILSTFKFLD